MTFTFPAIASIIICGSSPAYGSVLYTLRGVEATLLQIDTKTLSIREIGPLNLPFQFGDLAWDTEQNSLYLGNGIGQPFLATVDTATGAGTVIGDHNVIPLAGLTFDSSTHTLYASSLGLPGHLFRLDPRTALAMNVGPFTPFFISGIGSLAYDSRSSRLLGNSEGFTDLYEIDRNTGDLNQVSDGGPNPRMSLAYDPVFNRLWAVDRSGTLSSYDLNEQFPTAVPLLTGLGDIQGLAFVQTIPEPGSLVLLCIGLATLGIFGGRQCNRCRWN
jgi:hypothetical protein